MREVFLQSAAVDDQGRELTMQDIEALALGAWILGTGGGSDPYHKLLNMRLLYKAGHRARP